MKRFLLALLIGLISFSMLAAYSPVYPVTVKPLGNTVAVDGAGSLPLGDDNAYLVIDGLNVTFSRTCKHLHIVTSPLSKPAEVHVSYYLKGNRPNEAEIMFLEPGSTTSGIVLGYFLRVKITAVNGAPLISFLYCDTGF